MNRVYLVEGWFIMAKRLRVLADMLQLPPLTPYLYRRLRGPISRAELARRCGIHIHAVAGWEQGRHHPRDAALWELWTNFLEWTKRARVNPYDVLNGKWPRGVPSPDARRAARQQKYTAGTSPAPLPTAAPPPSPGPPPTSREGGAKKMLTHPSGE